VLAQYPVFVGAHGGAPKKAQKMNLNLNNEAQMIAVLATLKKLPEIAGPAVLRRAEACYNAGLLDRPDLCERAGLSAEDVSYIKKAVENLKARG
jgi:hypothetical protein